VQWVRGAYQGPLSSVLVAVRVRDSDRSPFGDVVRKEETWFV
jgi:hypothetical protein